MPFTFNDSTHTTWESSKNNFPILNSVFLMIAVEHLNMWKLFTDNSLVLVNECTGCLVGSIHPAVGYFGMDAGNLEPYFGSVAAAFLLFSKLTLKVGKFLLIASGMTGIAGFFTVRCDEQIH